MKYKSFYMKYLYFSNGKCQTKFTDKNECVEEQCLGENYYESTKHLINDDIHGIVINMVISSSLKQYTNLAKDIRKKSKYRYPIVFIYKKKDALSFTNEFVFTYGLGQYIYCLTEQCFLEPNTTNAEQTNAEEPTEPSKEDFYKIVEFIREHQTPLTDIQLEHLKMYYNPAQMIHRIKHDAEYPHLIESCKTRLSSLLKEDILQSNSTNKFIDKLKTGQLPTLCEEILSKLQNQETHTTNNKDIFVLMLEDEDILHDAIKELKKEKIHIIQAKTVDDAIQELLEKTQLKKYILDEKIGEPNCEYSVILCDTLLQSKYQDSNNTPKEIYWVNSGQGYDFLKKLEQIEQTYGIILLSNLPRNFKVEIANYTQLRFRNFTMKSQLLKNTESGKNLQSSDSDANTVEKGIDTFRTALNQLADMIVDANTENENDIVKSAFEGKPSIALQYIKYRDTVGFDSVFDDGKTLIREFIDYVNNAQKGCLTQEDLIFHNTQLKGLTTPFNGISNEQELDNEVEKFVSTLYECSFNVFCETLKNTKIDLSDEDTKSYLSIPKKNMDEFVLKVKQSFFYTDYGKKQNVAENIINDSELFKIFIEGCYNQTCSPHIFLEQFKLRDDLRKFVKLLLIHQNKKTEDDKSLRKRYIVRRFALFLFFWTHCAKESTLNDIKNLYIETYNYKNEKTGLTMTAKELTNQSLICEILNHGKDNQSKGKQGKGKSENEYKIDAGITSKYLWIKNIEYSENENTVDFMTKEESDFFTLLFNDIKTYFDSNKQNVSIKNFKRVL